MIFRFTLYSGYVSKSLPDPEKLLEICFMFGLPIRNGHRVASKCLEKLVDWIYNNMTSKSGKGLIKKMSVGRPREKEQWEIKISTALFYALKDRTSRTRDASVDERFGISLPRRRCTRVSCAVAILGRRSLSKKPSRRRFPTHFPTRIPASPTKPSRSPEFQGKCSAPKASKMSPHPQAH